MNMKIREKIDTFVEKVKKLQGDPHYVALGMGIGVFISITPTIPFHTAIAVAFAFVLRGSIPAAVVGVWFSNPLTIPIFYLGSYKAGMFIFGYSSPLSGKVESITQLLDMGLDVTIAMITGGVVIGIIPGVVAYFITRSLFVRIRAKRK